MARLLLSLFNFVRMSAVRCWERLDLNIVRDDDRWCDDCSRKPPRPQWDRGC